MTDTTFTEWQLAEIKRDKAMKENVTNLMEQFADLVNYNTVDKTMVDTALLALLNQHRTLQQSMVRLMVNVMVEYGKTNWYDRRNENSVEFGKKLAKMVDEENVYFPYI